MIQDRLERALAHDSGRTRVALLLVAGWLLSLLVALGSTPAVHSAEKRLWQTALAMEASGDWLVPRFQGEVRLQKPPLPYWIVAGATRLAGEESLLALRLPSALAAALTALVLWAWARSIGGTSLALAAVVGLLLMQQLANYGRRGEAEALLALLTTAALACGERALHAPRPWHLPAFALALALAFLTKGTAALLVVGLPLVLALALERRLGAVLAPRVLAWTLLGLLLGASWYLVILRVVPGATDLFFGDLLLPFGVVHGEPQGALHDAPLDYYLKRGLVAMFPAALLLPVLAWRALRTRFWRGAPSLRLAAAGCAALFVVFSLLPQKQRHYLLPLLPLLALPWGEAVLAFWREKPRAAARVLRAAGILLAVVGTAGACAHVGFLAVVLQRSPLVWGALAGIVALVLLVGVRAAWRGQTALFTGALLVWMAVTLAVHAGTVELWQAEWRTGHVLERPDYDAARWAGFKQRWPVLDELFELYAEDRG